METKGKTVFQWLAEYVEVNGHFPTKPIYMDQRCIPAVKKELIMTFDEFDRPWVNEYNKETHGEVNKDNFHIFIPYIH